MIILEAEGQDRVAPERRQAPAGRLGEALWSRLVLGRRSSRASTRAGADPLPGHRHWQALSARFCRRWPRRTSSPCVSRRMNQGRGGAEAAACLPAPAVDFGGLRSRPKPCSLPAQVHGGPPSAQSGFAHHQVAASAVSLAMALPPCAVSRRPERGSGAS